MFPASCFQHGNGRRRTTRSSCCRRGAVTPPRGGGCWRPRRCRSRNALSCGRAARPCAIPARASRRWHIRPATPSSSRRASGQEAKAAGCLRHGRHAVATRLQSNQDPLLRARSPSPPRAHQHERQQACRDCGCRPWHNRQLQEEVGSTARPPRRQRRAACRCWGPLPRGLGKGPSLRFQRHEHRLRCLLRFVRWQSGRPDCTHHRPPQGGNADGNDGLSPPPAPRRQAVLMDGCV